MTVVYVSDSVPKPLFSKIQQDLSSQYQVFPLNKKGLKGTKIFYGHGTDLAEVSRQIHQAILEDFDCRILFLDLGHALPFPPRGYEWKKLPRTDYPWKFAFELVKDATQKLREIKDYGDWTVPWSKQVGQWVPKTFIRVSELLKLPLWLLLDPRRVFVSGKQAKEGLRRTELKGRDERWYPLLDRYFTPAQQDRIIERNQYRITDEGEVLARKIIRSPVRNRLYGPEILTRFPLDISLMMSVSGWPIRYVPVNYLIFLISDGEFLGPKAPWHRRVYIPPGGSDYWPLRQQAEYVELRHQVSYRVYQTREADGRWKTYFLENEEPKEPYIRDENLTFGPFRAWEFTKAVRKYLDSYEGQEKLRQKDIDWFEESSEFSPAGVWLRKPRKIFANTPTLKGVLLYTMPTNSFSGRDQDRHGNWYTHGIPIWLEVEGKPRGTRSRLVQSSWSDPDPAPSHHLEVRHPSFVSSGVRRVRGSMVNHRMGKTHPTGLTYGFDPPGEWDYPSAPQTGVEAYNRCNQICLFLEGLIREWEERWDVLCGGWINWRDRLDHENSREEARDFLITVEFEVIYQIMAYLKDERIFEEALDLLDLARRVINGEVTREEDDAETWTEEEL